MYPLKRSLVQLCRRQIRCMSQSASVPIASLPILGNELLEHINPVNDAVVLDMTFGSGGHTELILKSNPTVKVLALDRDPVSYMVAKSLADKYPNRLFPLLGKFSELPSLIEPLGYYKESIDVMLFHCGCSSFQMDDPNRGFSYLLDGSLDMRMDGSDSSTGIKALDVLDFANEIDLKNIFKLYGSLKPGKKIARAILHLRHTSLAVKTTKDFREMLVSEIGLSNKEVRSAFRSLRYFVNDELNELGHGLVQAEWYLKQGGRLATISEAYLDDLIIKNQVTGHQPSNFTGPLPMKHSSFIASTESDDIVKKSPWTKLNKHVIIPEGDKLMTRTSKLRVLVKNEETDQDLSPVKEADYVC